MEHVNFVHRKMVEVAFDELNVEKAARDIKMHAPPFEARIIFNPDTGNRKTFFAVGLRESK